MQLLLVLALLNGISDTTNIEEVKKDVQAYKRLQDRGYIQNKEEFTKHASKIISKNLSEAEIEELSKIDPTLWSKVSGFLTFTNIVLFIAACLLVLAVVWLIGGYLIDFFAEVPLAAYEFFGYLVAIIGVLTSTNWPAYQIHIAFPCSLALIPAVILTHNRLKLSFNCFEFLICCLAWGFAAIYVNSAVLGFLSVAAFFGFLGFSIFVLPFCTIIGFNDDAAILKGTVSAFLIMLVHQFVTIGQHDAEVYRLFSSGMSIMGPFVYFIGLLIVANKWYCCKDPISYIVLNVITIISGFAAMYVGATYGDSTLLGISGTLFALWLVEKYYEIPWEGMGWAWSLLGLSGILYGLVIYSQNNPQYFMW